MNTLTQEYATKVYNQVKAVIANSAQECKQYGGMAHKLPVLVRQAGLIQAMTFVDTRGKPGHKALLKDLARIVCDGDTESFLEKCRTNELADYIWLTRKTLAALEWYKRFAESVLEVKAGEDGGENDGD
jgi:CRISPR-associated protein Cmr5